MFSPSRLLIEHIRRCFEDFSLKLGAEEWMITAFLAKTNPPANIDPDSVIDLCLFIAYRAACAEMTQIAATRTFLPMHLSTFADDLEAFVSDEEPVHARDGGLGLFWISIAYKP